jgi:hypothetical protein
LAALAKLSPASRRPCATFVLAECHRLLLHRQRQQERLVRLLWQAALSLLLNQRP